MSDNGMDDLFDNLRARTQTVRLAEPADIRRTAAHRRVVLRGLLAAVVTLVVAGGGITAYSLGVFAAGPARQIPGIGTSGAPSPTPPPPSTPGPANSSPPASSGSASSNSGTSTNEQGPSGSTATSTNAVPDCRPANLDPRPYYFTGGAMGTSYTQIGVQNVSASRCRLYGHPTLLTIDSRGHTTTVATTRELDAQPVVLGPGGWAEVTLSHVNGNPYGPDAPECAHPQSYNGNLALLIGGDLPYRLPGLQLAWQCDQPRMRPWTDDKPDVTVFTRAPAP